VCVCDDDDDDIYDDYIYKQQGAPNTGFIGTLSSRRGQSGMYMNAVLTYADII